MRVQFEFTIDDVVDVQLRVLRHSRAARSWRWRDRLLTSLLTGTMLFAIVPEEKGKRAGFCLVYMDATRHRRFLRHWLLRH